MIPQRVFLISSFKHQWNDAWFYRHGFEENGHIVEICDPSKDKASVTMVFEQVKKFEPDIILHTKDELPPEVFQELREIAKVIQWYPDVTIHSRLRDYVASSDIFFTMSEGHISYLKKFNENIFWLTQAFEPSFFKISNITESDRVAYTSDITFVGSLGSKDFYRKRQQALNLILQKGFNLRWWGPRLPVKLSTIPLLIGRLGRAYGGRFVWGGEHAKIARLSKIYLGIDAMPQVRKSMSERMYIAVGCGAFYMCLHVDGIEDVLEPDKEIVTFRDDEEMLDKIKFYLRHDSARERIARAGQERVLKEHTYEVRIRQMMSIIQDVID